jgi:hypothetical protein
LTSPELTRLIDRRVSAEELREALDRPIGADEREDVLSLARWFTTRYQSPEARLKILPGSVVDDIEISRQPCRSVESGGKASDDDKSDISGGEDPDQRRKLRHGLDKVAPALRNSSACL